MGKLFLSVDDDFKMNYLPRKFLTSFPECVKINNCKLLSYGYKGYFGSYQVGS